MKLSKEMKEKVRNHPILSNIKESDLKLLDLDADGDFDDADIQHLDELLEEQPSTSRVRQPVQRQQQSLEDYLPQGYLDEDEPTSQQARQPQKQEPKKQQPQKQQRAPQRTPRTIEHRREEYEENAYHEGERYAEYRGPRETPEYGVKSSLVPVDNPDDGLLHRGYRMTVPQLPILRYENLHYKPVGQIYKYRKPQIHVYGWD